MEAFLNFIKSFLEPTGILIFSILLLFINSWTFKRIKSVASDENITKKTISFLIVLFGALSFILALPIDGSLKGQILSFLAIVISAGIALSSTTVLGNLMAGLMNNAMKRFRNGDLIKIENMHGRVTKTSTFHTEIQLEDSNFMTIPNLYIASYPVKLIRKANTVVSTNVSLGYDVARVKIENALKEAAIATGLTDPYVYITSLGDFSVVYRIHGFLEDSSKYFSTSSMLNAMVMDVLHAKEIEIVSPSFMNQRKVEGQVFIPKISREKIVPSNESSPEELIFDEAIKSEKIELKKDYLVELEKKKTELTEKIKVTEGVAEIKRIESSILNIDKLKARVEKSIEDQKNKEG